MMLFRKGYSTASNVLIWQPPILSHSAQFSFSVKAMILFHFSGSLTSGLSKTLVQGLAQLSKANPSKDRSQSHHSQTRQLSEFLTMGELPLSIPGTSFAIWKFSSPVNISYCQHQPPQCLPEDPVDTLATRLQRGKRRRQNENGPSETMESKSLSVKCFLSNPFTTRKSHVFTISWRGELTPSTTWQSRERTPQGKEALGSFSRTAWDKGTMEDQKRQVPAYPDWKSLIGSL